MSTLRVLDETGDTEVTWLLDQEESIETAAKLFNDLIEKGYMAYAIRQAEQGHKAPKQIIYDFDEELEEIVMTPGLRGG